MPGFLDQIEPLKQAAVAELAAAPDLAALEHVKGSYLGPHGKFTALMKQLAALSKEEKPAAGKLVNQAKAELEAALVTRRAELELRSAAPEEPTDFTLPGRRRHLGKLHPLSQVTEDIVRCFRRIGFAVADGPEIEDEYHCFDALNTPADHPARDTQDTFYLQGAGAADSPAPLLLRTHNPTFQQIDGVYVDKNVTVGDLKGTVEFVFKELLGAELKSRFRPHYFSYTEPSFEIDFSSPLVKKLGKEWLEIAGCGMIHPAVFEKVGYDPEVWTGWAFGVGIE